MDFKRFYLEKYHQYVRSRKIHWTLITQEMKEDLQIDFFLRKVLWTFLWDPTEKRQYPKSSPPPKKKDFFSDWVGLLEICFPSSKMTDPRPCPRGRAYFRVPSCSAETCQAQTNNKLSAAEIDQRNITGKNSKCLSVMTDDLITFCQVRSRCSAEGLTLPCS